MSIKKDFALEVYFSQWEFKARYHMAASDAESMTIQELLSYASDEDRQAFDNCWLGYTESFGAEDLRQVIANNYETITGEDIVCFAGAEEGIYIAMRTLLDADDHMIVLTPNYQAAETIPLSICSVTGVALEEDQHWDLDMEKIKAAIRPNTRLISINFPNNPTGKILAEQAFDELIRLCRQYDIWLFSDEVYRLIERDCSRRLPQAVDVYEKGISLNVMSKAYGLPGLRLGWIACKDRQLLLRMERYKHYLSICNSAPSERLAVIALKAGDKVLNRVRKIANDNLQGFSVFLAEFDHLFSWTLPDGGCIGYVKYHGSDGVESFTRKILQEASVLLLPASLYHSDVGNSPEGYFRIGFGRADFLQGLAVMRQWLLKKGF